MCYSVFFQHERIGKTFQCALLSLALTACGSSDGSGSADQNLGQDLNAEASIASDNRTGPNLVLTASGVNDIRANLSSYSLFEDAFVKTKAALDAQMLEEIVVPIPKDAGGGYTHEQHKRNYKTIHDAGLLFQVTGEQKYADFAKDILLEYSELFPTLGRHPVIRSNTPGRLFWQSLNEAVWLVYSIQGYDSIRDAISDEDREKIEKDLFIPIATFLSEGQPYTFDRIHNHATWAVAGVGMTGFVLEREDLVQKALYGLDQSGEFGFLKQMDELFSPDGYYNEGPYYQRYALMPFVVFAQAIQNNQPQLEIFEYRDQILLKAVYGVVQLSYNGLFFPLNDAIKDKGISTAELLYGVSIAYGITGDPGLLSIAREQNAVVLTGDGLALARGLDENLDEPFAFRSMQFSDGPRGDRGALAILRSGVEPGHQALVMKNTAQGLGHGHFDKLSWLYFDNGHEIVRDYGAARFLNVEPKNGGAYLPENTTWAKQTVAHNTLVVDETTHFGGDWKYAENFSPKTLMFDVQEQVQLVSAEMSGAYEDVDFVRTMAMINDAGLEHPLIVDILKVKSAKAHQYDLPLHYRGHIINLNFSAAANLDALPVLGEDNGYQHLWLKAQGKPEEASLAQVSWIQDNRFYTQSAISQGDTEFLFAELGANDPNFNLRRENAVIQRVSGAKDHTFVSLLESHGEYNGTLEYTLDPYSSIADIELVEQGSIDFLRIETKSGKQFGLAIAYEASEETSNTFVYAEQEFEWQGYYKLFEL